MFSYTYIANFLITHQFISELMELFIHKLIRFYLTFNQTIHAALIVNLIVSFCKQLINLIVSQYCLLNCGQCDTDADILEVMKIYVHFFIDQLVYLL